MTDAATDARWMAAALALAERGRGTSRPNPNVGALLIRGDRVVGAGWTQPGGRPHAEAMALDQAGADARGATLYVTLEPCAHRDGRGASCADRIVAAGIARVVIAARDPDARTAGQGAARLSDARIAVTEGVSGESARRAMAPWWSRVTRSRPFVTLKLATSLDGAIALADGTSRWITGERARAHAHLERARHDAFLVGGATVRADATRGDVRLPGLEDRAPQRLILTRGAAPAGWRAVRDPADLDALDDIQSVLIEGGAATAAAFLATDRVDRLLLYRAPILIGGGRTALSDIGLSELDAAHDRWIATDSRLLGKDRLDVYHRAAPA